MAEHEANELRQLMEQDLRELMLVLAGVGDASASQRSQPDAWSVKELLASLSEGIRVRFNGLADALGDPRRALPPQAPATVPEKLAAIVATCGTVTTLVARCRADFEDLANLVAAAPSERLAAHVELAPAAGDGTTTVELLAWVRAAYVLEFQEVLAAVRAARSGTKG